MSALTGNCQCWILHQGECMMGPITTFDNTQESLLDLLRSVRRGKTQLPDFQRGWVWDDERIRSLLSSVSQAYPIGVVMMLQSGGADVSFRPRLVEGVRLDRPPSPDRLILDGQQRLTALFQALYNAGPAETRDVRGKPLKRWYYVDMAGALSPNGDREEAIVGLPEERQLRNFRGEVIHDYSTIGKECQAEYFPLPLVFDTAGLTAWQMEYLQADPERLRDRLARWNQLVQQVIQPFQQYQVPVIILRKEIPKVAVCQVFERVNTGGVSLNVFELLTAAYAAEGFNLREDWSSRSRQFRAIPVLASVENTDFLQAVTLLATLASRRLSLERGQNSENAPGVSCKRREILDLKLGDYRTWADRVTQGFVQAGKLLHSQKIFVARDLPYRTQLTPLAAVMTSLGPKGEHVGALAKLVRWYWCGVFGELYGGSVESRLAKDVPEVLAWLHGGPEPSTVVEANFVPSRLNTLRTRNSAAYKGLFALLIRDGGRDFLGGQPIDVHVYFDERIDIHHVFPKGYCAKAGIDLRIADSIVNRIPLAARTNRMIGSNPPSIYLAKLQKIADITPETMNAILEGHRINPVHVRVDAFDSFFAARREALLDRIESAMGKPIARGAAGDSVLAVDNEPEDDYEADS